MNPGQPSQTAVMVCAYRARHPELCHDAWAAALAGDDGPAIARRYDQVNPHTGLYIGVRTAFIDAEVRRALREGVDQVVLLGAGLDTRAERLAAPGVRFFEVDRPETQTDKLARLRALERYPVTAATYVSCDLGREDFIDRLLACGFSAARPAFFIWEGVTMYLTEAAVRATLRRVADGAHPRSTIVFDSIERKLAEGRSTREKDKDMLALLADLGEPITFGVNDVTPLLHEEGFRHIRTVSFDQACLTFTGTYERERAFRFSHLVMATREPPAD